MSLQRAAIRNRLAAVETELEPAAASEPTAKALLVLFDRRTLGGDDGDPMEPLVALFEGLIRHGVPPEIALELPNVAVGRDPESWEEFALRMPGIVERYIADLIHGAVANGAAPAAAAHLAQPAFRRAALARSEGRGYGPDFGRVVTELAAGGPPARSEGHA